MDSSDYQFITFQNADDFKSRAKRRAVRSHIVKRTFERKKGDFRNANVRHLEQERRIIRLNSPSPDRITAINHEMLDPFESLPVDQAQLQTLIRHPIAQQAVEPVFSISDPYSFHNLHGAYTNALADPAFSNALMCAISLVKNNYTFTRDVLQYQGRAIEYINQQLSSHSSYECTIGAILLLIGVEWRTYSIENARIHLRGIRDLLEICEAENRNLSASVRRGIFWQDVNTAIVSAKDRVLERTTFPEFQWSLFTFMVDWRRPCPGFEDLRGDLGGASIEPLRDIYRIFTDISVFQKHSEALTYCKPDLRSIDSMDNMQACIESRIIERLQECGDNQLRTAVLLAAYLYTYSLFTQIWNSSSIPTHISSRLLSQLQVLVEDTLWEPRRSVVLWCIIVTGSLTPTGSTRTGCGLLLQTHFGELVLTTSIHTAWFTLSGTLERFLWSQVIFGPQALAFVEENVVLVPPFDSSNLVIK